MVTHAQKIFVSKTIGEVSTELYLPEKIEALFVFAHGAGAGMHHPFMINLSNALAAKNIGTLRFNFPFMEGKKKRPDVPAVAHQTIQSAIAKAKELFPGGKIFVGGKSFGGRMSSQLLAKQPDAHIQGIIFVGFPLHPPGKPGTERAEHLKEVSVPMLFLQGTRDELATWNLIEEVTKTLPQATLVKVEGADHSFKAGKQNLLPELAEAIHRWVITH